MKDREYIEGPGAEGRERPRLQGGDVPTFKSMRLKPEELTQDTEWAAEYGVVETAGKGMIPLISGQRIRQN
jgi:hypothetical protein